MARGKSESERELKVFEIIPLNGFFSREFHQKPKTIA
jgi:hypothetical protein